MGDGIPQPMPFHFRWLLPMLLGKRLRSWFWVSAGSALGAAAGISVLAMQHGASQLQAAMAAGLFLGLPAVRFAVVRAPVLPEMPMMCLAVAAAVLWPISPPAAIAVALLGGMVNEKTPVWAALFAFQPLLLAGLLAPLLRVVFRWPIPPHEDDPHRATMHKPWRAGLLAVGRWRSARLILLPWGACMAALWAPSPWLLLALAVAYGQLLFETDTVRPYQEAAPVVCIVAAMTIPVAWFLPIIIAHWVHPWVGEGV
jgi:hypothetical protein